jgi:acyl carrier protein
MDIVEHLRHVIQGALGAKQRLDIAPTASLADVVTSSLQFVVVLAEIERAFDIVVPDDDLGPEKFRDLATIAQLIERVRDQAAGEPR